ncbi:hypothetical protein [Actinomyces minihominis]|uniref:hypothetical protein n=1 Tax=Actinomyces minihominis TaxID=2002838 RepID=UPI00101AEBD7|nr:hypothetical protein [Actinomyces minihominis]
MIATALAAITMAVVSSRLTSFSSSILIVGVISVVSALSSEFYRIVITSSAEKTKQVVAPILGHVDPALAEDATAVLGKVDEGEAADGEALDQTKVLPVPEADVIEGTVTVPETDEKRPGFWRIMLSNQVVQMSLIFLVVALITVGVSYGVARAQGGDEYNSNYYTSITQSLSEEDKQALLDAAAAIAKAEAEANGQQSSSVTPEVNPELEGALAKLEQLVNENAQLQANIDSLSQSLESEQAKTNELLARLEALEALLGPPTEDTPAEP